MSISERRDGTRRGSRALSRSNEVGCNGLTRNTNGNGGGGGCGHSPMSREGRLSSVTSSGGAADGGHNGSGHGRGGVGGGGHGGGGGNGGGGGLGKHIMPGDSLEGSATHTPRKSSTASQPMNPFGLPSAAGEYTSRALLSIFDCSNLPFILN